jgi:hypothetical protein
MTRRRLPVALTLLALLLLAAAPVRAADQAWLVGRWDLLRDPDGGAQDWLEFNREGQVAMAKRNGPRYTGRYHASDDAVQIDYKIGSQSVITTLTPSSDRRELYARSAVTGMNAVYEKRP